MKSRLATVGAVIVALVVVAALMAPFVATTDPIEQDLTVALKPPFWMQDGSLDHPLGTDHLGRDVYSRAVYGARISVTVGFATVALATLMAAAIGVSSAYVGGTYDIVIQRVVDAWMSFPALVVVLSLMAALGPGLLNLIFALSILGAASASRGSPARRGRCAQRRS